MLSPFLLHYAIDIPSFEAKNIFFRLKSSIICLSSYKESIICFAFSLQILYLVFPQWTQLRRCTISVQFHNVSNIKIV